MDTANSVPSPRGEGAHDTWESEVHDVVRQPAVRERTNVSVASFGAKFMPFTVMVAEAKEGGVLNGTTNVLTGASKVSALNLPVPTTEPTVTA